MQLEDLDLDPLADCKRLHQIQFTGAMNEHIEKLPNSTSLRHLTLRWCTLDKHSMASVSRCEKIESIEFNGCTFPGDHLGRLRGMPCLQQVRFFQCKPAANYETDNSPSGRQPRFSFERIPMTGSIRLPKTKTDFPIEQFEVWLESTLPGINVTGWRSNL